MSTHVRILGIAGSLRRGSYNQAALRAAKLLVPQNSEIDLFQLDGIPMFNEDDEKRARTVLKEIEEAGRKLREMQGGGRPPGDGGQNMRRPEGGPDGFKRPEGSGDGARPRPGQDGKPPGDRTVVRILYDADNVYVGIDCPQAVPVVARLTRRDRWVEADNVTVVLDTRGDGKSALEFGINAAGVLSDALHFNDTDFTADGRLLQNNIGQRPGIPGGQCCSFQSGRRLPRAIAP